MTVSLYFRFCASSLSEGKQLLCSAVVAFCRNRNPECVMRLVKSPLSGPTSTSMPPKKIYSWILSTAGERQSCVNIEIRIDFRKFIERSHLCVSQKTYFFPLDRALSLVDRKSHDLVAAVKRKALVSRLITQKLLEGS